MKRKVYKIVFVIIICLISLSWIRAQNFLNGSFEMHKLDSCGINLNNDVFTSSIEFVTAFGDKDEVDMLSAKCGYGNVPDSTFFIALNVHSSSDAVSLELQNRLTAGKKYAFSYYERSGLSDFTSLGVEIGISEVPDAFGQLIYSSKNLSETWTKNHVEFTAPINAKYVTVSINENSESWIFLDGFTKSCPAEISLGNDTILCELTNMILKPDSSYDTYLWQDNSEGEVLPIDKPGLYWLQVSSEDCILSDSILIEEYPDNCSCDIQLPNIFSPNLDGINETFGLKADCDFTFFELIIFSRWGNVVFKTRDPDSEWDGLLKNQKLASGVYIYTVRYRLRYNDAIRYKTGDVSIIR